MSIRRMLARRPGGVVGYLRYATPVGADYQKSIPSERLKLSWVAA